MEGTVFVPALEGMKHVKSDNGEMLTKEFLEVCKQIMPVIDKFGAAMALVKSDIGGNITRLENKFLTSPSEFNLLYNMVRVEVEAKTAKGSSSCTNGLLWLTRAMDFLVELFRNLLEHEDWTMPQACADSYQKTLKKWHGWLASSTFSLAMKLAPDRKKFMDVICGTGDINADIEKFCTNFTPLLEENHKFLKTGVDFQPRGLHLLQGIMGTKMKGLLKGLKQFSQRFDDKEEEMQIGLPTDVKHVAHIGWDGPSVESPSWLKEYKGGGVAQSAPLGFSGLPVENPEKQWVSQDSTRKKSIRSSSRDIPELPKSSRRPSADSPASIPSPNRDPSKSRTRRHSGKESDGSGTGSRRSKELSNDPNQADIPKKTRRKKPKDPAHRSSKSKDKDKELSNNGESQDSLPPTSFSDPFSEPGLDNIDSMTRPPGNEVLPASKLKPFVPEVEQANVAVA